MNDPFELHMHHHHHHHLHHHPPGSEQAGDVSKRLASLETTLMTVSTEVKNVLDLARQNATVVGSVDQGMKALTIQVADLKSQIAALQTAPATLSDEDKAALIESANDLQTSISTLQADIPTNVTAVQQPSTAAQPSQQTLDQHQQDSQAASQATPMGGVQLGQGQVLQPGQSTPPQPGQPASIPPGFNPDGSVNQNGQAPVGTPVPQTDSQGNAINDPNALSPGNANTGAVPSPNSDNPGPQGLPNK